MTRAGNHPRRRTRCAGDGGAALVEFTFVSILLLLLVFGIINFGLILSFKQDMTRAAAEGARAGAVALAGQAAADAYAETDRAVREFGDKFSAQGCKTAGMKDSFGAADCEVSVLDCGGSTNDPAVPDCVTVTLTYDYAAEPLLPPIPLLAGILPNEIKAASVAKVNE
jgi:Flp pilus assembly protein TadG